MTDKIIEHIKQAYIQHVATHKTYPDYNSDYIHDFIDYQLLKTYLDATKFDERFKYIQKCAENIYQYVANNYCKDPFVYEEYFARYDIEDTKELVEVIQLIAEYEEEI